MGSAAMRNVTLSILGLALFWSWTHLLAFAPADWVSTGGADDIAWTASNVASCATLVAMLLASRPGLLPFERLGTLWCVALLAALASGATFLPGAASGLSLAGIVVASACDMLLIGSWATRYARMGTPRKQTGVTLSAMLLSFLLFIALLALPAGQGRLAIPALPVISAACLSVLRACDADDGDWGARQSRADEPPVADNPVASRPPVIVLGFILVFSIPLNYLQGGVGIGPMRTGGGGLVFALALGILCVVCLSEWAALRREMTALPTATVLALSVSLFAAPFASGGGETAVSACVTAGYFLFLSVTYLQLGRYAREHRDEVDAPTAFAWGMLANAAGLLLGSALGLLARTFSSALASVVTIVIVYGLFLLGLTILPRRVRTVLLGKGEREAAAEPQNQYVANMVASINAQCELAARAFGLTPREQGVLGYLMRGWSLQMIAEAEDLTRNTVKTHVTHIYQKLSVHTREEMALLVESLGDGA